MTDFAALNRSAEADDDARDEARAHHVRECERNGVCWYCRGDQTVKNFTGAWVPCGECDASGLSERERERRQEAIDWLAAVIVRRQRQMRDGARKGRAA